MNARPDFNGGRRLNAKIWDGAITEPGLYLGVPEDTYHSDPCPEPSLSSHVAKIALKRSVRHAQVAHPRFIDEDLVAEQADDEAEEDDNRTPARHLLIGQAAHSLMLGRGAAVVECKVKAFRSKDAKAQRRLILDAGGIPLKTADFRTAVRMAKIASPIWRAQFGGEFIPEVMLAWQERGLWRRGLMDGVSPDLRVMGDYKTCGQPCPPPVAAKFVNSNGYPFQEAFYKRGGDALDPAGCGRRRFFFMMQEVEYPHAISIVETNEANRTLAEEQVEAACNIWDRAMMTGAWPAYSLEPYIAAPAPWDLTSWEERAMSDETINPMEFAQ